MNTVAEAFGDVLIVPKYSEVKTRDKVDLTTSLGKFNLELPVVSANMKTITGPRMALQMHMEGGLGILHRFNPIKDAIREFELVNGAKNFYTGGPIKMSIKTEGKEAKYVCEANRCGVSIGVQEEDRRRFVGLYDAGATIFCIDVAHGHHQLVKEMLKWITNQLFKWDRAGRGKITLIAGNIATNEAAYDLAEWGADVVKVGIGPGSVCQTRQRTGVGNPQLCALREVWEEIMRQALKIRVIADGGVTCTGDIAKALKYADAVMIGAVLAGTTETPGDVYPEPGTNLVNRQYYKLYGGSASMENKVSNGLDGRFVEGEMIKVPFKGHAKYLLREIREGLQSAFSYVGATNMVEFRNNCVLKQMTDSGRQESKI